MGKVLFLGVEGSGKSCLTAALASYFEAHAENGWSLRPENKEAFAFSTRMPKRLAAGELPAQTARFRHLRWSLCYKDEPQRTLDVLDYPGEVYRLAFLDPEDDPHPETLKARQTAHADEIRELMTFAKDAEQIFVLFNLSDAKNLETDDQNIDAVWVTVQTLKILGSLESKPQLTLLITQADRLVNEGEDVSDVNVLLKKYAPIIGQHCKSIDARLVSSLESESEKWGMTPLITILTARAKCMIYQRLGQDIENIIAKYSPPENRYWRGDHDWFSTAFFQFKTRFTETHSFNIDEDEALCVYDFTYWRSTKRGMVLSRRGFAIMWNDAGHGAEVSWLEVAKKAVSLDGRMLRIGEKVLDLTCCSTGFVREFGNMLGQIRRTINAI